MNIGQGIEWKVIEGQGKNIKDLAKLCNALAAMVKENADLIAIQQKRIEQTSDRVEDIYQQIKKTNKDKKEQLNRGE